jgi:hypothetical protein
VSYWTTSKLTDTDGQQYVNSYLHTHLEQRTRRTVRQDSDERPDTAATRRRYWRAKISQMFVRQYEQVRELLFYPFDCFRTVFSRQGLQAASVDFPS